MLRRKFKACGKLCEGADVVKSALGSNPFVVAPQPGPYLVAASKLPRFGLKPLLNLTRPSTFRGQRRLSMTPIDLILIAALCAWRRESDSSNTDRQKRWRRSPTGMTLKPSARAVLS